jgi:hypothetical protein
MITLVSLLLLANLREQRAMVYFLELVFVNVSL